MSTLARDTIIDLLRHRVAEDGDKLALWRKVGRDFQPLRWRQVEQDIRRFSVALLEMGVSPGDHIAILSPNSYEWVLADLAIQTVGAVSVPLHVTLASQQILWQLQDAECRFVLCSPDQAEKLVAVAESSSSSCRCVALAAAATASDVPPFKTLDHWLPPGVDDDTWNSLVQRRLPKISPERLATVLYTSGTSGRPKGVMLNQGNLAFNAQATPDATGEAAEDLKLCFLPLSHIFARTCDVFIWIARGNQLAIAESQKSVLDDCQAIRPTWINGVPYFFDRVRRRLVSGEFGDGRQTLRQVFGARIRSCQCGGAPVSRETYDFYWRNGVPLFPGYGLTESSPVISVSAPGRVAFGAVGLPIAGVKVRIDNGEIQTQGPHVMRGYWKDEAATREAIVDGWLRTGDLGHFDKQGLLRITGRRRELIVTTGAKNIAPTLIESLLQEDPLIEQAMVIGDGRDFLSALIVPDLSKLREAVSPKLAELPDEEMLLSPAAYREMEVRIRQRLTCLSRHEQVKKFVLLPRAFSIEAGELTSKRSYRRSVIEARYARQISEMYER